MHEKHDMYFFSAAVETFRGERMRKWFPKTSNSICTRTIKNNGWDFQYKLNSTQLIRWITFDWLIVVLKVILRGDFISHFLMAVRTLCWLWAQQAILQQLYSLCLLSQNPIYPGCLDTEGVHTYILWRVSRVHTYSCYSTSELTSAELSKMMSCCAAGHYISMSSPSEFWILQMEW